MPPGPGEEAGVNRKEIEMIAGKSLWSSWTRPARATMVFLYSEIDLKPIPEGLAGSQPGNERGMFIAFPPLWDFAHCF
jgi:hypothetical protein